MSDNSQFDDGRSGSQTIQMKRRILKMSLRIIQEGDPSHYPKNIQTHFFGQDNNDQIARDALRVIAKANSISLDETINHLFNKNHVCAEIFETIINMRYPDKYEQIEYCTMCNKFNLIDKIR